MACATPNELDQISAVLDLRGVGTLQSVWSRLRCLQHGHRLNLLQTFRNRAVGRRRARCGDGGNRKQEPYGRVLSIHATLIFEVAGG